jgi:hypothetical protein
VKKEPIKIKKTPTGSVRFWFYKLETEKTKPNPNRKNQKKNRKNRAKTKKTEPNRFEPVFVLKNRNRSV